MLFGFGKKDGEKTAREACVEAAPKVDPALLIRRRYRYVGQVQGVGFRWNAKRIADGMGMTGWVRNEDDGSVTCVLQGTQDQLATFATRLRESLSNWARYTIDDMEDEPVQAAEKDFRVRY